MSDPIPPPTVELSWLGDNADGQPHALLRGTESAIALIAHTLPLYGEVTVEAVDGSIVLRPVTR